MEGDAAIAAATAAAADTPVSKMVSNGFAPSGVALLQPAWPLLRDGAIPETAGMPDEVSQLRKLMEVVPSLSMTVARRMVLPAATVRAMLQGGALSVSVLHSVLATGSEVGPGNAVPPARIEGCFPIGLALAPNPITQSALAKALPDPARISRDVYNSVLSSVRGDSRASVSEARGLMTALLACGPPGRSALISWLGEVAAVSSPLAKEHHQQVGLPSDAFVLQLVAAITAAARPVLDPASAKLQLVDPAFVLVSAPATPDVTKATPLLPLKAPAPSTGDVSAQGAATTVGEDCSAADVARVALTALQHVDSSFAPADAAPGAAEAETGSSAPDPLPGAQWHLLTDDRCGRAFKAGLDGFGSSSGLFWMASAAARIGAAPIARKLNQARRNAGYYQHTGDTVRAAMMVRYIIGTEAYLGDSDPAGVGTMLARWSASALVYIAKAAGGVPVGAAATPEAIASREAWSTAPAAPVAGSASASAADATGTDPSEPAAVESVSGLNGVALQAPTVRRDVWESLLAGGVRDGLDAKSLRGVATLASGMLLPEWLAQDAADVASTVAHLAADAFDNLHGGDRAAEALLEALTVLMAAAHRFSSPHMPAKLAQVVLRLFVPPDKHPDNRDRPASAPPLVHSSHCQAALLRSGFACRFLPQALMSLYGEVERTGPSEKLDHRCTIMAVLHHLWSLPPYRASLLHTARGVVASAPATDVAEPDSAASDAASEAASAAAASAAAAPATSSTSAAPDDTVVLSAAEVLGRFAHGIVTQTTSLLGTAIEAIGQLVAVKRRLEEQAEHIRATGSAEGGPLSEEAHTEARTAEQSHSEEAKRNLQLADQSVAMMHLLAVSAPAALLQGTVGTRLATVLLKLLYNMAGGQASQIVLDEQTRISIGFAPKVLLAQLVRTVGALSSKPQFVESSVASGMADPDELERVLSLVARKNILEGDTVADAAFATYCADLKKRSALAKLDEEKLGEIPDCFSDPITCVMLADPVRLPSGGVLSRSTVVDWLRGKQEDPYNRQPMTIADVTPMPALETLMNRWARARMDGDAAAADALVESAEALKEANRCT